MKSEMEKRIKEIKAINSKITDEYARRAVEHEFKIKGKKV